MKKKLKGEPICILKGNKKSGKGFYLHENLIITAHHNFGDFSADIVWAFFPTDDFILIYKIKFNSESYMSYPDADTGVLIFDGDPSPLGDGLNQRVWRYPPRPGIKVYINVFDEETLNFTQSYGETGKRLKNEFIISTNGQEGDSGTPIFIDETGEILGIYRGVTEYCEDIGVGIVCAIPEHDFHNYSWKARNNNWIKQLIISISSVFLTRL